MDIPCNVMGTPVYYPGKVMKLYNRKKDNERIKGNKKRFRPHKRTYD
jgi:hypothetical protein